MGETILTPPRPAVSPTIAGLTHYRPSAAAASAALQAMNEHGTRGVAILEAEPNNAHDEFAHQSAGGRTRTSDTSYVPPACSSFNQNTGLRLGLQPGDDAPR